MIIKSEVEIAKELGRDGFSICPGFLSAAQLSETCLDFSQVYDGGGFHRAGVGQGSRLEVRDLVRQDEIFWLGNGLASPAQSALLKSCAKLRKAFNEFLFLGLTDFEGHYANYPTGGFYRRHLDAFDDRKRTMLDQPGRTKKRIVSILIYLNNDWRPQYGGRLRLYDGDLQCDIDPIGGTLICFLSAEKEHEVLTSHHERKSFAGWFTRLG